MAGEMHHINQQGEDDSGNVWELHAAIAEAVNGELRPFDQYQGPYIVVGSDLTAGERPYAVPVQHLGIVRLWVCGQNDCEAVVYREDNDQRSPPFWWDDTEAAIAAARGLL